MERNAREQGTRNAPGNAPGNASSVLVRLLPVVAALPVVLAVSAQTSPMPSANRAPVAEEQALHNLRPETCRQALGTLIKESRGNRDVLWIWADQSPQDTIAWDDTLNWVRPDAAPTPYAINPNAPNAKLPVWACTFPLNSVHALSIGGRVGPRPSLGVMAHTVPYPL